MGCLRQMIPNDGFACHIFQIIFTNILWYPKVVQYSALKFPYFFGGVGRRGGGKVSKNCDIRDGFSKVTFFISIFFILISGRLLQTWYQKIQQRFNFSLHYVRPFTELCMKLEQRNSRWREMCVPYVTEKTPKLYCSPLSYKRSQNLKVRNFEKYKLMCFQV